MKLLIIGLFFCTIITGIFAMSQQETYSFQLTKLNSNGTVIGTFESSETRTESQWQKLAAIESNSGIIILIGTGSESPTEAVTLIEIVGVNGVSFGNVHLVCESLK